MTSNRTFKMQDRTAHTVLRQRGGYIYTSPWRSWYMHGHRGPGFLLWDSTAPSTSCLCDRTPPAYCATLPEVKRRPSLGKTRACCEQPSVRRKGSKTGRRRGAGFAYMADTEGWPRSIDGVSTQSTMRAFGRPTVPVCGQRVLHRNESRRGREGIRLRKWLHGTFQRKLVR